MYGKECVMNVEKNKNKENLNLMIRESGGCNDPWAILRTLNKGPNSNFLD